MPKLITALLLCLIALPTRAEDPQPIPLWPAESLTPKPDPAKPEVGKDRDIGRWVTAVSEPTITVYPAPADKNTGTAIVICPGGGYGGLALDWEGHYVAKWLNTIGVTGVVLKYRMPQPQVTKSEIPLPLRDSRRALEMVRSRAQEWKIDPKRIGIMGFSAGGHLASTTGTHLEKPSDDSTDPLARVSSRPDFMVLVYPVITFEPPIAHMGSRNSLIGKDADAALVELYSNEKQVTAETPPTFLAHASDDPVKVENSQLFLAALRAKKVPCELVEFGTGGHGFGLGTRGGDPAVWPDQLALWLKHQKLLDTK